MLFVASSLLLYSLVLLSREITNIIDIKFVEFANQINELKKENNELKSINKTNNVLNRKSSVPIIYSCFN